jgi:hypothetical protein
MVLFGGLDEAAQFLAGFLPSGFRAVIRQNFLERFPELDETHQIFETLHRI